MTNDPLHRPSVLLAGGAGYVGSRLAAHLSSIGWKVVIGSRNPRPIPALSAHPVEYHPLDWTDENKLTDAASRCDFIVQLAAPNEIRAGQSAEEAVEGTVLTTTRLLRASEAAGASKFLYFSTAHVYGSPLEGFLEERSPAKPSHPYSICHRCAEDFVMAHRGNMIPVAIRLSNSIGAPLSPDTDRWKLLGNDLCRQVVETGCIRLQSDGTALRDFIPMADVCRAVQFLLESRLPAGDNLYNVGAGQSLSILSIAELVADVWENAGHASPPIHVGPQTARSPEFTLSIDKLLSLGFRTSTTLREEITKTLLVCETCFSKNTRSHS